MKSKHKSFNFDNSLVRIEDNLYSTTTYEDADDVPDVEDLTFTNGKFVKCSAIFIDLRGSSDLIESHKKQSKSLARIYRAYISEMVAIVNSFETCREINIIGDCVSAIFSGKGNESYLHESLRAASMANGMMKVLNKKYRNKWKDFENLKAGIGIAEGRALVIKAGYKGSSINDLIYMGDVVNKASKMCGLVHKEYASPICVTEKVYESSSKCSANQDGDTFQDLLTQRIHLKFGSVYTGNYSRTDFTEWVKNN